MVGLKDKDNPRAIYSMAKGKDPVAQTDNFGLLDGLYQMRNGDICSPTGRPAHSRAGTRRTACRSLPGTSKAPRFLRFPNEQETSSLCLTWSKARSA